MNMRKQCPICHYAHTGRGPCCVPCKRRARIAELVRVMGLLGAGLMIAWAVSWVLS